MADKLTAICKKIADSVTPEDIFGKPKGNSIDERLKWLQLKYDRLLKILDSGKAADAQVPAASDAKVMLDELCQWARTGIIKGTYGSSGEENSAEKTKPGETFAVKTKKGEYTFDKEPFAEGEISLAFRDYWQGPGASSPQPIVAKIVNDPADNGFVQNEARVLKLLRAEESNQNKHLPLLIDQFKTRDGRWGNILTFFEGYDLVAVREKYKKGIDRKHMIWMLKRLLSVVGHAHSKGIVHCNIDPSHVLISPSDHNACLIDWSYAVVKPEESGERFKVLNEEYSAPEVGQRKPPLPSSDLYSAGKCMVYLLGGDLETNYVPESIEEELRRFILFFLLGSPYQRAQDAWEMYEKLDKLIIRLWGPKKFLNFEM